MEETHTAFRCHSGIDSREDKWCSSIQDDFIPSVSYVNENESSLWWSWARRVDLLSLTSLTRRSRSNICDQRTDQRTDQKKQHDRGLRVQHNSTVLLKTPRTKNSTVVLKKEGKTREESGDSRLIFVLSFLCSEDFFIWRFVVFRRDWHYSHRSESCCCSSYMSLSLVFLVQGVTPQISRRSWT